MKNYYSIYQVLILCAFVIFIASCKNNQSLQVVESNNIYDITGTSALFVGTVISDESNLVIEKGVCWSTKNTPTISDSIICIVAETGQFKASVKNLLPNTNYYARTFVKFADGIVYGKILSFSTLSMAVVTTLPISVLTSHTVLTGGKILSDGGFEVSAIGVCWDTIPNPTVDKNITTQTVETELDKTHGSFNSCIYGILLSGTTYYLRAFAKTSAGTSYGQQISFRTWGGTPGKSVSDIDGNVYNTITLGTQTWMVENLKTSRYRNGDMIETTNMSTSDISNEKNPSYQWSYQGVESNASTYGRLYTWYAATDSRGIAPKGWHIPTDAEYDTLVSYLHQNGYDSKGAQVKIYRNVVGKALASILKWEFDFDEISGNIGCVASSNNLSCFNALPAGERKESGEFKYLTITTLFWTITESTEWLTYAWARQLVYNTPDLYDCIVLKNTGCSIRCIKDNDIKNIEKRETVYDLYKSKSTEYKKLQRKI